MKRTILFLCSLLSLNTVLAAGATDAPARQRTISLEEAITLARVQSVDAAVALNELKTAYWEYRTFRADLLPEVNFEQLPADERPALHRPEHLVYGRYLVSEYLARFPPSVGRNGGGP